ncbi:META domain-containing protein [Minwuia thermotolerans]|uniref:Secreted protein containing HslJ-like protein n=1 Tax=Minwuia thermotolerans TaxID=2056226 RepID=A0A2M9G5B8_9PROT|nr:META domain-containing protein [Minwuia thermotolerans]PJK30901.1 hypothetical protein CVT23_04325 [Minwuia thermotolerans]
MQRLMISAAALLTLAAAGGAAAQDQGTAYRCGDVDVDLQRTDSGPEIMIGDERRHLIRVRSASGARYESAGGGEPVLFWDKGATALLKVGATETLDCRRAEHGPFLPFEARGQEPGWLLEITADRIRLEADYGERTVTMPTPPPETGPGVRTYRAAREDHALDIRIADRLCQDSMAGTPYPKTVTVTLDHETWEGCGGEPRDLLTGARWAVTALAGADSVGERPPSMIFDHEGRLYGQASCNAYTTSYDLNGPEFSTGPVAATKKACAGPLMETESRFLHLLGEVRGYRIGEDRVLVLDAGQAGEITARRTE